MIDYAHRLKVYGIDDRTLANDLKEILRLFLMKSFMNTNDQGSPSPVTCFVCTSY